MLKQQSLVQNLHGNRSTPSNSLVEANKLHIINHVIDWTL